MTIINALPFNLQNGTTADATQVDANFNEVVNDVNSNAAHNGVNTDITALTGLVTPIAPAAGGSAIFYGAGSGTANAQIVASTAPTGFTLTAGYSVYWIPSASNTGALQLNVNSTGLTNVMVQTESGPEACIGGEVFANQLAKATYDGTQFLLDLDVMSGFGTTLNLASATTTDLGTAKSHTVNITGTTTITSFGSTALLQRPLYKLVFSGALILTYNATSLILPGSTSITTANGDSADALYLGSGNWQIIAYNKRTGQALNFNPTFIQNYISGLTLSTAGGSGTFGIAAGLGVDSTNVSAMLLNSAYTKTTASWAVGSGNGGLDTGAIANTTWYHVFLIERVDTGVTDILFSLSATSPTMPANYTLFRRIGTMKTDGSAHWVLFQQIGDEFLLDTPVTDINGTITATASTQTLASVPTGIVVNALINIGIQQANAGVFVYLSALSVADIAPTSAAVTIRTLVASVANYQGRFQIRTNISAQFRARSDSGSTTLICNTMGWIDTRGKQ